MAFYKQAEASLDAFKSEVAQTTTTSTVPLATDIQSNIPLYDMATIDLTAHRAALMAEWSDVMAKGPGVFVLKHAYADTASIDRASQIYADIIAEERETKSSGADHFAAAGANDRIWNSLQKLCLRDPACFIDYFGNPAIDAACEAWLGPGYQMTAQVNLVRPGGKAQSPHRDYHLGFMTTERAEAYPTHAHHLSPALTLQGAIAHCDMPVESGPTKLLPYSQMFGPGYLAFTRDDFRAFFEENYVQLPLEKGDALFFSPALYHAAGDNISQDIQRLANLVQIGSAFGRSLEAIDRVAMCKAVYPHLLGQNPDDPNVAAAIASTAEGYPFPTSLDTDPPEGGQLVPDSQADIMRRALSQDLTPAGFNALLDTKEAKRTP